MKFLQQLSLVMVVLGASLYGLLVYSNTADISYEYISPEELGLVQAQGYHLLDFRTPTEQEQGTISSMAFALSTTLDEPSLEAELGSFNPKNRYLIYDRNGKNIAQIVPLLKELGFREVKILAGGYQAWLAYVGK
ncbi:MAG: rhodanese-like domain-containing protein [Patescibacteria group bacterium]